MSNSDEGNGTAKGILDNEQVFQLFMAAVDERVSSRLQARFDVFRNWLSIIIAVLVVVIPTVGGFFYSYVVEDITREAAQEAVDRAIGEARFDSQASALNFRVLSIDIAEAFSKEDAEAIISAIGSLYSQHPNAESRDKLKFAIETAAKNFAQANRPDFIYRLEGIAPEVFQTSGAISEVMTQLLGNRLLADVGTPNSWTKPESPMGKTYENYRRYADIANLNGYPEVYLAYEMLMRSIDEGDSVNQIISLIEDTNRLNEQDTLAFDNLMTSLLVGDSGAAGAERAASRTKDFFCRFEDQSTRLRTISRDTELDFVQLQRVSVRITD